VRKHLPFLLFSSKSGVPGNVRFCAGSEPPRQVASDPQASFGWTIVKVPIFATLALTSLAAP
jgi:hypothetical protein